MILCNNSHLFLMFSDKIGWTQNSDILQIKTFSSVVLEDSLCISNFEEKLLSNLFDSIFLKLNTFKLFVYKIQFSIFLYTTLLYLVLLNSFFCITLYHWINYFCITPTCITLYCIQTSYVQPFQTSCKKWCWTAAQNLLSWPFCKHLLATIFLDQLRPKVRSMTGKKESRCSKRLQNNGTKK